VVTNLVLAIRGASAVTLVSAILVLAARSPPAIAIGSMMLSFSRPWAPPGRGCSVPTRWNI